MGANAPASRCSRNEANASQTFLDRGIQSEFGRGCPLPCLAALGPRRVLAELGRRRARGRIHSPGGLRPVADGPVMPAGDGAVPQLGDPVASCDGCPVCGGALASATTGVSFCTKDCMSDTDCPTGTACVPDPVSLSSPRSA